MPLHVALVDLEEGPGGCTNKDQTGSFGSSMRAGGLAGRIFRLLKRRRVRIPIQSFAYVAAILRSRGHKVTIHEAAPEAADIVLVATSIVGYRQELDFARATKARLGCTVGFTGAFARAKPELFLDAGDFVVDGEPEAWALGLDDCTGGTGVLAFDPIDDLDALPFPDWNGFPLAAYGYRPLLKNRPFLTVLGSRGCPFGCSYCHHLPMQGTRWRSRDPEAVVEEVAYLQREFGMKSLLFRDVLFSYDMDRARAIAEGLRARGCSLEWGCETRTDRLDRDLIRTMKEAGLRFINLGVEAADEEHLARAGRKSVPREQIEDLIRFCENLGVWINAFYILGFPDDTEESVRRTIDYACRLDTTLAQFCVFTPYPGTRIHDEANAAGRLLDVDWSEYTTYNPVMRLDHLSRDDVLRLLKKAYGRYFLRPRWMLSKGLPLLARL